LISASSLARGCNKPDCAKVVADLAVRLFYKRKQLLVLEKHTQDAIKIS